MRCINTENNEKIENTHRKMSEVINIKELNERIERESVFVDTLRSEMGKVIIGQNHLIDTLLIGLLSNGHILLEGVPGLAKNAGHHHAGQGGRCRFLAHSVHPPTCCRPT